MENIGLKRRASIYDIAKEVNVSATTVYKALNGKPKVSEETRKLILDSQRCHKRHEGCFL